MLGFRFIFLLAALVILIYQQLHLIYLWIIPATLWAFSKVCQSDHRLFSVMLVAAVTCSSQSVSHTAARGIDAMPRGAVSLQYDSQQARVIKYLRLVALSAHSGIPGT